MLCSIPVSRGEGSDLPSYHQTTEVTLTKDSPERSGYMHIDKQVMLYHSGYALLFAGHQDSQSRGPVACLQTQTLSTRIPRWQPKVQRCSPFIVPSLDSTRDPYDITSWCHDHLLWSSGRKTTVHAHWNHHGSSVHLPASTPKPNILQKLQASSSLS